MSIRVSTTQVFESSAQSINDAYSRFVTAQTQVDTGKQLQKPSDNPTGIAQSLDFKQQVSELDQYGRTLDQANGFLSTSESALGSITTLVQQARTIAVQGGSDNTNGDSRQALAGQLQNIISQVQNIGNTSYGSRYVFAGQRTTTPPFQGAGDSIVYKGGSDATGDANLKLEIGRGESLTTNVSGDKVFTPLFSVLNKLQGDIANGDSGTVSKQDLAAVDAQLNNILATRADFGAKINRISATKQSNDLTKSNFTQFISNIEDANIPKAVVELQSAQVAYQASLSATSRAFQTSLLDFLK